MQHSSILLFKFVYLIQNFFFNTMQSYYALKDK